MITSVSCLQLFVTLAVPTEVLVLGLTHAPARVDGRVAPVPVVRRQKQIPPQAMNSLAKPHHSMLLVTDINECASSNGGCVGTCHNTAGSYYCTCSSGYTLGSDGHSCNGELQEHVS